jgi:hypothetical protein
MALFDNFGANLFPSIQRNSDALLQSGLGLLAGKTGNEQAALGLKGFSDARKLNKTVEFLKSANPELAQAVEAGSLGAGDAYKLYYQQKLEAQKPKNNFMAVGKRLYDTNTREWIDPPGGVGGADDQEYGLNPQYGTDENGNPVIIQLSKGGTSRRTALPDGVSLSKEPIRIDAGTHTVLLDPITRQPIGQISKNLSTAAEETAGGKALAENKAALPKIEEAANNMLSTIDSLSNDPYLDSMVGSVQGKWLPNVSSDAARVQSKMDQIGGQSFLQAYNALRGGGQITEVEGKKATEAMSRLNTAQTEKDYREALAELRGIVATGVSRARAAAQGSNSGSAPAPTAPNGTNYKSKYGLD